MVQTESGGGTPMSTKVEPRMMSCTRCGKQIEEEKALYRGDSAQKINERFSGNWDWRNFAHCAACDWEDFRNSPGGM